MHRFDLAVLYVADIAVSQRFYERLLRRPAASATSSFVLFAQPKGPELGLWSRDVVAPRPDAEAGAAELVWHDPAPDAIHADWLACGITIAQPPADAVFGRSFVALDPDGHRLRVIAPSQA